MAMVTDHMALGSLRPLQSSKLKARRARRGGARGVMQAKGGVLKGEVSINEYQSLKVSLVGTISFNSYRHPEV